MIMCVASACVFPIRIPIEVGEDESLHSHHLDMIDLNDEGDGNHETEYKFNLDKII